MLIWVLIELIEVNGFKMWIISLVILNFILIFVWLILFVKCWVEKVIVLIIFVKVFIWLLIEFKL